jgi:hypothetical protein
LNAVPTQLPVVDVGVITYVTTTGAVVILVKVSVIGEPVPAVFAGLLIPVTAALVHA